MWSVISRHIQEAYPGAVYAEDLYRPDAAWRNETHIDEEMRCVCIAYGSCVIDVVEARSRDNDSGYAAREQEIRGRHCPHK